MNPTLDATLGVNSNATCSPSSQWSSNSLGQTPCLVAAYLGSVCNNGQFTVPAINATEFYQPPTVDQAAKAGPCACSSVYYSLLSACAECQGAEILQCESKWSTYTTNCTEVDLTIFAGSIPSDTAFPHWAYQNVTVGNAFNSTLAQLQVNAPESTAIPAATSTATPSMAANTSSQSKSNAGPIAGGVIGGVVLLSLICIAVCWFMRRRRRGVAPSNSISTPMGYHATGEVTPFTSAAPSPKPYDHADPSTFASSPSSAMYASAMAQSTYSGNTATGLLHTRQYSGAAEV
ncbi:hypothetical protein GGX14DRAFT_592282 [Mycena pura]|uniref:Uncharacterized protein n=1 Tax=Mycena pura TaxID=153505 RepID=A0AAD6YG24_9AGAR|nr:hypothetical protein GGX14DRAFT_592282 [Mycena pura]